MCRAAVKAIEKDRLGITCRSICKLIEYEIEDRGFFCKIERIWKEIPGNIYFVANYNTGKNNLDEFEKEFFKKYRIKIKFIPNGNLPNKASSFFIAKEFQYSR